MTIALETDPLPLRMDEHGTIRVSGTRLTLDTVIAVFKQGATAEQIADQFPPTPLADIYAVIAYYLHHRGEVEAYLTRREAEAEALQREVEKLPGAMALREKLLRAREARGIA